MPSFSKTSLRRLAELHPDLQTVLREAILVTDFSIICGHRGEDEQEAAYASGHSHLHWPMSRHNATPSLAVDLVPWPIDWQNIKRFYFLAGVLFACAHKLGIKLAWGGNWKSLKDFPHFELPETVNTPT